jgi:hypothetical protein
LGREAKTEATEEFKELEQEMTMRQDGISHSSLARPLRGSDLSVGLDKLYTAAALYIRAMGKKKEGEDREKALPPEILGNAMVSHGGEYASESAYGQALLRLGSGMERIGRLQEVRPCGSQTLEMSRRRCSPYCYFTLLFCVEY